MDRRAPKPSTRQERRIRWQYGLSKAQARIVADLHYGGAR